MNKKKVKLLYALLDKYEKNGETRSKYCKIGVDITDTDDQGREFSYLLLDRHINLAGFPNYSKDEKSKSLFVSKFEASGKEEDTIEREGDVVF